MILSTMKKIKIIFVFFVLYLYSNSSSSQTNNTEINILKTITSDIKLTVDTTSPPQDSLTMKILVLRSERGPLNFENVIRLSILDAQSKDTTLSKEYYDRLLDSCQIGSAHHVIENILVNLYRQCLSEKEVDQLIEFYKTPLGKKWFIELLIITTTATPAIKDIIHKTAEELEIEMKSESKIK